VEWLFTEIFGCCPAPSHKLRDRTSMLPRPTQPPLARAVNQIQGESRNGQDYKYACKQQQGRQHLPDKIDLQSDKGREPQPHPLSGFVFAECLTDFQWNEPFPATNTSAYLDAILYSRDAYSI
jgi:hypothetical protein